MEPSCDSWDHHFVAREWREGVLVVVVVVVESDSEEMVCYFFDEGKGRGERFTCIGGTLRTHNSSMSIFNKMKSRNQMIKSLHRHRSELIKRSLLYPRNSLYRDLC